MKTKVLETKTTINRPLQEVFNFFSKAENLNELTPPALHFNIITPLPIEMKKGVNIQYRIKLSGIPFYWKTLISEWNPPYKFADEQLNGPYAVWHHEHIFEEKDGKTIMTDKITYKSKGWVLAPLLHALFVDKRVKEIFTYREKRLHEIFPVI